MRSLNNAPAWKISYVFWEFGGVFDNIVVGFIIYAAQGGQYAWRIADPAEKLPHVHPQIASWVRSIAEHRMARATSEHWDDERFRTNSGRRPGDGNVWMSWSETAAVLIPEGETPEDAADVIAKATLTARDITKL